MYAVGAPANAAVESGEHPDLVPVKTRWQFYPPAVKGVKFSRSGKPWFQIRAGAARLTLLQIKKQVEQATGLERPWVAGAMVVLADRDNRVWLVPDLNPRLLLGYDPASRTWIERPVVPPGQREGYDEKDGNTAGCVFTGSAHEDAAGCLYFGDRLGVHVFRGGQWSYAPFYSRNLKEGLFYGDIRSFNDIEFAEDEGGRVVAWSPWGRYGWSGTVGYFVHDNGVWQHVDRVGDTKIQRLNAVIPLRYGMRLVCRDGGTALLSAPDRLPDEIRQGIVADIRLLAAESFRDRKGAEERLASLGPLAADALGQAAASASDPEVLMRLRRILGIADEEATSGPWSLARCEMSVARAFCSDANSNTWVWAHSCRVRPGDERPGRFWLITPTGLVLAAPKDTGDWTPDGAFLDSKGRMYFARYEKGCRMFERGAWQPVTDETMLDYRYILGEDRDGRIYLTTEAQVAGFSHTNSDERPALETVLLEVPRSETVVCQDTKGRIWAKLAGNEYPFLSVATGDKWRHCPAPDGRLIKEVTFLQPLRDACLIAEERPKQTAFFFNGDDWLVYPTIRALVEEQYKLLVGLVDSRRAGRDQYTRLHAGAGGRLWLCEWEQCLVYDGKRWTDPTPQIKGGNNDIGSFNLCLPAGGNRMFLSTDKVSVLAAADDNGVTLARPEATAGGGVASDYTTRSGLRFDSRGRIWLPRNDASCVVLDGTNTVVMPDTGWPRFQDSAGDTWFLQASKGLIVVLSANGARATLKEDQLHATTAVREDASGTFWVGTGDGLLNVAKKPTGNGGIALEPIRRYTRDIPRGSCLEMFSDASGFLWFYGPGPNNYRLYRIRLPQGPERQPANP